MSSTLLARLTTWTSQRCRRADRCGRTPRSGSFVSATRCTCAPTVVAAAAGSGTHCYVTVASLTTSGNADQLVCHLGLAKENGATEQELIEAITHLAFYAGWPKAMSAMAVAKQVFRGDQD